MGVILINSVAGMMKAMVFPASRATSNSRSYDMRGEYSAVVQTRDVELGHFAAPDAGTPPGIVLIHDVWGLGDHARDLAQRLAGEGFGALAVDLYRRERDVKIEDPGAWMRGLSDPEVLADVQAGIDFLAAEGPTAGRPAFRFTGHTVSPARKSSQTGVPTGTPQRDIPHREFASRAVDAARWFRVQCTGGSSIAGEYPRFFLRHDPSTGLEKD